MQADLKCSVVLHAGLHIIIETHGFEVQYIFTAGILRNQAGCRLSVPGRCPLTVIEFFIHAEDIIIRRLDAGRRGPEREPAALIDRLCDNDRTAEAVSLPLFHGGLCQRIDDFFLGSRIPAVSHLPDRLQCGCLRRRIHLCSRGIDTGIRNIPAAPAHLGIINIRNNDTG